MGAMKEENAPVADAIAGGTVAVPLKAVLLAMAVSILLLLAGYGLLFGWLGLEVADLGESVSRLEERVEVLIEGQREIRLYLMEERK